MSTFRVPTMSQAVRGRMIAEHADVLRAARITCGAGWAGILSDLALRLRGTGTRILDVKEKFGSMQVTCHFGTARTSEYVAYSALVNEAEERSEEICELCGAPGRLRTEEDGPGFEWNKTACDDCVLASSVLED